MITESMYITVNDWTQLCTGVCMVQPKADILLHISSSGVVDNDVGFLYTKDSIHINTDAATSVWIKKLSPDPIHIVIAKG